MLIHIDFGPFCVSLNVSMARVGHEDTSELEYTDVSADHGIGFTRMDDEE